MDCPADPGRVGEQIIDASGSHLREESSGGDENDSARTRGKLSCHSAAKVVQLFVVLKIVSRDGIQHRIEEFESSSQDRTSQHTVDQFFDVPVTQMVDRSLELAFFDGSKVVKNDNMDDSCLGEVRCTFVRSSVGPFCASEGVGEQGGTCSRSSVVLSLLLKVLMRVQCCSVSLRVLTSSGEHCPGVREKGGAVPCSYRQVLSHVTDLKELGFVNFASGGFGAV